MQPDATYETGQNGIRVVIPFERGSVEGEISARARLSSRQLRLNSLIR